MAIIMGNVVGSGSAPLKTLILQDPSGIEITGVVTESEQVFNARPQDIRIGKTAATDIGVVEGTNTITYRTTISSVLVFPGEEVSILLRTHNRYNYTKIQCTITVFQSEYLDNVVTKYITIGDNVFSIETSEKISNITANDNNKSIDLNFSNASEYIYEVFFATYRVEE